MEFVVPSSAPSRNRPLSRTPDVSAQTVLLYLYPSGTKPEQMRERNKLVRELFAADVSNLDVFAVKFEPLAPLARILTVIRSNNRG